MTRAELTRYIFDTYSVEPDYPFSDDNVSAVFRHPANCKWFALAMNIPARRLGLPSDARMDIVNLKCDPQPHRLAPRRARPLPRLSHEQGKLDHRRARRKRFRRNPQNAAGYKPSGDRAEGQRETALTLLRHKKELSSLNRTFQEANI